MKIVRLLIGEPNDNISNMNILFVYYYTNFGVPFRFAFFSIIPRSCKSNFISYLIPNVVQSSIISLSSISTQFVFSTSFFNSNTTRTIPSTSYLTSIATKCKSIFLLIPTCSLSKNNWNSCNELVARFNIFRIWSFYYRNSKLKIYFVLIKWFLVGKIDSYEMWLEILAFISLVLVPWYPKLALNGLIELFVVLVPSPNLGNFLKTIRQEFNLVFLDVVFYTHNVSFLITILCVQNFKFAIISFLLKVTLDPITNPEVVQIWSEIDGLLNFSQ